ncbi:hypothetical protein [Natribacillus halophilus]|nr:hypothetical protein [Natribacillus halophilus]
MKKWLWILAIATICFAVYYDFSRGTLPVVDSSQPAEESPTEIAQTNVERTVDVEIEAGQTLLSVMEQLHETGMGADMEMIKADFRLLNDNQPPEELQQGEVYTFPLYEG